MQKLVNAYLFGLLNAKSFEAYVFLREALKFCENKLEFVVDRGFWYLWALKRLKLKYRHETFGKRNAVESFIY